MKNTQNLTRQVALKRTALVTALAGCLLAGSAFAQTAPAATDAPDQAKTQNLETITVTGSRIRSVDVETAQPVFTLDRQEIQKQGFVSVGDILAHLTNAGAAGVNKSTVLVSNSYAGGSYVDLRSLGLARTLVLVDGRRWGTNTDGFTDLDTIPSSIIERVEVLKDGASAIYGSDAIAGVVNIITRQSFDGAEVNSYYGKYGQGDGTNQQYDFTFGKTIDKLSLIGSGTYAKTSPVWARDRDFSAYPKGQYHPTDGLSPYGPGGLITNGPNDSTLKLRPGGDPRNIADYAPYNPATDNYDANQQMMLSSGSERKSLFGKAVYKFNDNLSLHSDVLYNERTANIQVAGYPIGTGNTGLFVDKDSYYNPLGTQSGAAVPQDVEFDRRGTEDPRITKNTVKTYRVGTGLDGAFQVGERYFNWDVSGYVNKNDGEIYGTGNYDLTKTQQALGPSFKGADGVVRCGTPTAVIAGCVPLNILAGNGGVTQDMLGWSGRPTSSTYGSKTTGFSANITGDVIQLPAGMSQFAAGVEYRRESGFTNVDANSQAGNSTDLASNPSSGSYNTKEAYVELNIPVLRDLPGAQQLSFDLASRYSDYSNFGNTTNSKFGLTWKPIEDLLVRGSYSQGFRAPTINDLYGGQGQTFDAYTDPCDSVFGAAASNTSVAATCRGAGLGTNFRQTDATGTPNTAPGGASTTPFLSGSNPNLKPETSASKSLGLVYSPSFVQGLDVSLDWYNIRITNVISSISPDDVLNACYLRNDANSCGMFTRNAQTGQVENLVHTLTNEGWLETEGYDFSLNYHLPKYSFGQFTFHLDSNYVSKYNKKVNADTPQTNEAGLYSSDMVWRSRTNASLDWAYGNFGVNWGVRVYSNLKEDCAYNTAGGPDCDLPNFYTPGVGVTPKRTVGGIVFNDLQVRWSAPWNATFSVGANNVFDRKGAAFYTGPATSGDSQFAYNPAYDIGRFFYVRYNQKF
jgi:iron complex outermembrane recepter protein